jgi:hypothetical protein
MIRSTFACSTRSALAVGEGEVDDAPDDVLGVGAASAGGVALDDPEQAAHTRTSKVAMALPVDALISQDSRRTRQIRRDHSQRLPDR